MSAHTYLQGGGDDLFVYDFATDGLPTCEIVSSKITPGITFLNKNKSQLVPSCNKLIDVPFNSKYAILPFFKASSYHLCLAQGQFYIAARKLGSTLAINL